MKKFLATTLLLSSFLLPTAALADAGTPADAAPVVIDAGATTALDAGVVVAATLPAAQEASPNALTEVAGFAFSVLEPVLAMLLSWLLLKGASYLKKKTGIELPAAIEAKIDGWVGSGIHLAAEKSYQKVKAKTKKLSGPEKLETAAGFVIGMVKGQGWDTWTREMVEAKIEAKLGEHRANGGVPTTDKG